MSPTEASRSGLTVTATGAVGGRRPGRGRAPATRPGCSSTRPRMCEVAVAVGAGLAEGVPGAAAGARLEQDLGALGGVRAGQGEPAARRDDARAVALRACRRHRRRRAGCRSRSWRRGRRRRRSPTARPEQRGGALARGGGEAWERRRGAERGRAAAGGGRQGRPAGERRRGGRVAAGRRRSGRQGGRARGARRAARLRRGRGRRWAAGGAGARLAAPGERRPAARALCARSSSAGGGRVIWAASGSIATPWPSPRGRAGGRGTLRAGARVPRVRSCARGCAGGPPASAGGGRPSWSCPARWPWRGRAQGPAPRAACSSFAARPAASCCRRPARARGRGAAAL